MNTPDENHYLDRTAEITLSEKGALPHWEQKNKYTFVTFRLADSLPKSKIEEFQKQKTSWENHHPLPWTDEEKRLYHKLFPDNLEKICDNGYGSCILKDPKVAQILIDTITDEKDHVDLMGFVVMPNHIHALLLLTDDISLSKIMQQWKGKSSRQINTYLGRQGTLWMRESYDALVRSENQLKHYFNYITNNYRHGGVIIGGSWLTPPK